MQTFLPVADLKKSVECLDKKRLGKQRVEAYQLVMAIRDPKNGWHHHPAARMWAGYENALVQYGLFAHDEWIARGCLDTTRGRMEALLDNSKPIVLPPWFGDEKLHASHRSNLLRKLPEWYGKFGWTETSDLPYLWPS